jgi:hypothetical protein
VREVRCSFSLLDPSLPSSYVPAPTEQRKTDEARTLDFHLRSVPAAPPASSPSSCTPPALWSFVSSSPRSPTNPVNGSSSTFQLFRVFSGTRLRSRARRMINMLVCILGRLGIGQCAFLPLFLFSLFLSVSFSSRIDHRYDAFSALGNLLGCTPTLAAELNSTAFGFLSASEEKARLASNLASSASSMTNVDLHNNGDGAFYDVTSSALRAGGNLPKIKVDGPFGAPAEDVFKAEGASSSLPACSRVTHEREASLSSRRPHRCRYRRHSLRRNSSQHLVRFFLPSLSFLPPRFSANTPLNPQRTGTNNNKTVSELSVASTSSGSAATREAWGGSTRC